ncbi:MAG: NAD(P)H-hydrate dehydratase [Bacteroidetes bacterium]|nr:NAD(P)H-hydrate dehydratase [Bacteroidota bacterium]
MKILSSAQIRELDQFTIDHEPIAAIDLMERACQAFTDWFVARFGKEKRIGIVCGTGNNGGDGLGIARKLTELGYHVNVWEVKGNTESDGYKVNLLRLAPYIKVSEIKVLSPALFKDCDILLDAILGSGLSRPATGLIADVISAINNSLAIRIAVDIASGLPADGSMSGPVVRAHHTVSFQLPKLAFLLPENQDAVGEWHLVDIGLNTEYLESVPCQHFFVTPKSIKEIVRPRGRFSHKGNFGHALLIAGSFGKMGACILAARGALRSGVGLLTVHIPSCGYSILQTSVPEAMASVDPSETNFSAVPNELNYAAIGIGPGLGMDTETINSFAKTTKHFKKPMVIDADGLNILASNPELLSLVPKESILTPHPKEFERLVGKWSDDIDRLTRLKEFSSRHGLIIVLKGAYSAVATPEGDVYFNCSGNPGMATGGSGDVLTGILTGLLAQGYSPKETALLGVYLHGSAGDHFAQERCLESLTASDLVECLPEAFKKLKRA